jgi:DNA-directed RNA polymerase specialized sigma24 family protein
MSATPSARFPATAWSCIEAVRDPHHPKYVAAVNRLLTTYWRPACRFLRQKYPAAPDPEGLTQQFFLTLVTRGWLARADPTRGRFRDFLKTLLKRFAFDHVVRAPEQTQFERRFVSIHSLMDDADRAYEPPAGETPEEAFDKEWKAALLRTVRDNLGALYAATSDPDERQRFEIFAACTFVERGEDQPTQDALAERFGVSRDRVRYALDQVRKRWERLLRQEVRDQVGADVDVEEEIRKLL